MDIIDFLMKTLLDAVAWVFKILINVVVGLCSLIIKGIVSLFRKKEEQESKRRNPKSHNRVGKTHLTLWLCLQKYLLSMRMPATAQRDAVMYLAMVALVLVIIAKRCVLHSATRHTCGSVLLYPISRR